MGRYPGSSLLAATFVLLIGKPADASLITLPSDLALAGATTIDFESQILNDLFITTTISGVTFTAAAGGYQLKIEGVLDGGGPYGTAGAKNLSTASSNVGFSVTFANPVSAFGMRWGGANENWNVSLFDSNGSLLETLLFTGLAGGANPALSDFYGASNTGIKSVTFTAVAPDWIKIDDFQFVGPATGGQVPEPATIALVGAGTATLLARRRARLGTPKRVISSNLPARLLNQS